jgi:endonuclease/exonuclease/phosphatase family metal-dependent hydrolase
VSKRLQPGYATARRECYEAAVLAVVTWNVLHRVHAVNWREPAIDAHPDEAARIAAITRRIATGLPPADVVCLQEASGDQVASLRAALGGASIFTWTYGRVPSLHRPGPPPLADAAEHLVVLVRGPARLVHAETFPSDRGKGFLSVDVGGTLVVDTHTTPGPKHAAQCARLADHAAAHRGPVVITGDFNEDRATSLAHLGPGFTPALPREPALPTRPRTDASTKSQTIDHAMVRGATVVSAEVLGGEGLSDHNPLLVRISLAT